MNVKYYVDVCHPRLASLKKLFEHKGSHLLLEIVIQGYLRGECEGLTLDLNVASEIILRILRIYH